MLSFSLILWAIIVVINLQNLSSMVDSQSLDNPHTYIISFRSTEYLFFYLFSFLFSFKRSSRLLFIYSYSMFSQTSCLDGATPGFYFWFSSLSYALSFSTQGIVVVEAQFPFLLIWTKRSRCPFLNLGCQNSFSCLSPLTLWKLYMLSWRTKEEKLECLKYLGRMLLEKARMSLTTKELPRWDQEMMLSLSLFQRIQQVFQMKLLMESDWILLFERKDLDIRQKINYNTFYYLWLSPSHSTHYLFQNTLSILQHIINIYSPILTHKSIQLLFPNPMMMNQMLVTYPLKKSPPVQFADTLILILQDNYNSQTAYAFKDLLTKINDLRNKVVTQINNPQTSDEEIDKTIDIVSAYTKFANILLKRFNWNPESNKRIGAISFTWGDSFQKVQSSKNTIAFDIYCLYYNLAVLYFMRALKLSQVDLDSSRKEATGKAKAAAYVLKQMREKYHSEFINCGFHDTQSAHLATLQSLCLGLVYRCTFDTFKQSEYKIGINRIASIASRAHKHFSKAFGIASGYFTNQASGIFDKTKTEILSLAFVESLYFDVITNVKLAKYNAQLVEKSEVDKFPLVIGYQKKAYKTLEIALGNTNVEQLLNLHAVKKRELFSLKDELYTAIGKDIQRNNQIYHQKEIPEGQLPPAEQLPPEMDIKLPIPANLVLENEGQFSKLMSAESSKLAEQLMNFAKSRKTMLDGSFKKLNEEVTKVFIDSGVDFYLDDDSSTAQSVPQSVKAKINEINSLGGKYKLEEEMQKVKQSPEMAAEGIKQLRDQLGKESAWDDQKRMTYRQKWARQSSNSLNRQFYQRLQLIEEKLKAAVPIDSKVLAKYNKNYTYISILDQTDEQICLVLPRVQKINNTQNIQVINKMRDQVEKIKSNAQKIDELTKSIGQFLDKTNYVLIANETVGSQKPKEQVFKETFYPLQEKIQQFNMMCKVIKEQVQLTASMAVYLNNNSKNTQPSKIQHEGVLTSFNQIQSLFNNLSQSVTFYDKIRGHLLTTATAIDEFITNREVAGRELEDKIKGKGEPGGGTSRIISFPAINQNEEQFDYNMFKYDPNAVLETQEEIKYSPWPPATNPQGNPKLEAAKLDVNNQISETPPVETNMSIDEMMNHFCNILPPGFANDLRTKKQ